MIRYPNYADVPSHRPSVGAMRVSGNVDRHKPYVYRGLGFDQLEAQSPVKAGRVPAPSQRQPRRKATRAPSVAVKSVWGEPPVLTRQQEREQRRAQLAYELDERHAKALAEAERAEAQAAAAEPDTPKRKAETKAHKPRPAQGWRPTSGEDLEAWLDQLD